MTEEKSLKTQQFVVQRTETILGKGENGYKHFLIFTQFIKRFFALKVVNAWDCVIKS